MGEQPGRRISREEAASLVRDRAYVRIYSGAIGRSVAHTDRRTE